MCPQRHNEQMPWEGILPRAVYHYTFDPHTNTTLSIERFFSHNRVTTSLTVTVAVTLMNMYISAGLRTYGGAYTLFFLSVIRIPW